MKNNSKSLQPLNEASFDMPNVSINCNLNTENVLEQTIARRLAPQCHVEEINYQLTTICLKTLPHSWYSSPNPLRWR